MKTLFLMCLFFLVSTAMAFGSMSSVTNNTGPPAILPGSINSYNGLFAECVVLRSGNFLALMPTTTVEKSGLFALLPTTTIWRNANIALMPTTTIEKSITIAESIHFRHPVKCEVTQLKRPICLAEQVIF